ncbi:MAG: hypothetical protein K6T30_03485, partial [Alicyclobacillus sp.]|nr:hypothetical protein [Alicyclobacillus sp.]
MTLRLVLGLDTSNYTTSLCAVSWEDGLLVAEARRLLPVKPGERGLRQSDALFFHVRNLPELMDELMTEVRRRADPVEWAGVGVSVRPRPLARSYMPVFWAGQSFAHAFARMYGLPVVRTSHQEGHVAAACYFLSAGPQPGAEESAHQPGPAGGAPFLAVHLSGGTSDVLWCRPTRFGYAVHSLGEGADLHAGQMVDRVGVALGAPFPAGPWLAALAEQAPGFAADPSSEQPWEGGGRGVSGRGLHIKASVQGARMSFSGPCTAALRALERGVPGPEVALAVQRCIADSVALAVANAWQEKPVSDCVIAGGVASNRWIRARVLARLQQYVA